MVDLLQVVHCLVQHPVEALRELHCQLLRRRWHHGLLLSLHLLLQLTPLLLQFVELICRQLLAYRLQQRVDVFFLQLIEADLPRQL